MRRLLVRTALVLGAMLALAACHQNSTVLTVDGITDSVDANPGDGLCADDEGDCSFRAAVMEANALPGVEEIRLTPGLVTLSIAGKNEDGAAAGDLDIHEGVVITGGPTVIQASSGGRIFDLHHPEGLVEITDVRLRGGNEAVGAAIRSRHEGALHLARSSISNTNVDANVIDLAAGSGAAFISETTISANDGTGSVITNRGTFLYLRNAAIADNALQGIVTLAGGTTNLDHSTIVGNISGIDGQAAVRASIVAGNTNFDCGNDHGAGRASSQGYNIESGISCGFTELGDQQSTEPRVLPVSGSMPAVPAVAIAATSPARDQVPVDGTGTCAGGSDAVGTSRPVNSLCDVGATELTPGPGCATPTNGGATFCDLAGIDLKGAVVNFHSFTGTDFTGADLSGVEGMVADFTGSTFTGADLAYGDFNGSTFDRIAADDADFTGALLRATGWRDTDLANADLTNADLMGAHLGTADLSGVTWDNTVCPSGVNSDANGGNCNGQL